MKFDIVDLSDKPPYRTKSGRILTSEDIEALAEEAENGYEVSHLRGRKTWVVGYFVTVEVEARDSTDAIHVGEAAAGWPGDWRPLHGPVEVTGRLSGMRVKAKILRSIALMAHPKENND